MSAIALDIPRRRSWKWIESLSVAIVMAMLLMLSSSGSFDADEGSDEADFNVACSGTITSALQAAIDSAVDDEIIEIGAGSCTSGGVDVDDKNILIRGLGIGVTNISSGGGGWIDFTTSGSGSPQWRLSSMSLTGTCTGCSAITATAQGHASFRGPFRIDHMDINYPNNGVDGMLQFWGPIYGLLDHNEFTMSHEAVILTDLSIDTEDGTISNLFGKWAAEQAYTPGSATMLYIEDNVFNGLGDIGTSPVDTFYRGARLVFRHNTVNCGFLYAHWTRSSSANSLWWEVYNNVVDVDQCAEDVWPFRLQGGGTGLVYNNTVKATTYNIFLANEERNGGLSEAPLGQCGDVNLDGPGDTGASFWPCYLQTGRNADKTYAEMVGGAVQSSFPLYLWNNGPQDKCADPVAGGSACANTTTVANEDAYLTDNPHTNGDVDWCKSASQPSGCGTHTLTYTPYTYPYPWAGL